MLGPSMKENLFVITILGVLCAAAQAAEIKVSSPDGKAVITVTDAGGLSYSVTFDGREVVAKSRFGIVADDVDLGADVKLGKASSRKIRESYSMFGGHSQADNNCRETTVSVRSAGGETYELDVRAYNDGVALRVAAGGEAGPENQRRSDGMEIGRQSAGVVPDGSGQLRGNFPEQPVERFVRRKKTSVADHLHPARRRLRAGDGSESSELYRSRSAGRLQPFAARVFSHASPIATAGQPTTPWFSRGASRCWPAISMRW